MAKCAVLYDTIGSGYRDCRRSDERIASQILAELAEAKSILNVGAGVGSYEPKERAIVAVEPSWIMISQRSGKRLPVVQAFAEFLPFKDSSFDAVMAILTIHHWSDIERGLKEAVRVAKKRLVLLTWIGFVEEFWLLNYLPKIKEMDKPLFPSVDDLTRLLGQVRVIPVPIPHDCKDGFLCAYWRRPEAYLDEDVRRAISTFSRVTDFADGLKALAKDLNSGVWYQRYGSLLNHEQMDFGYRIVVYDKEAA